MQVTVGQLYVWMGRELSEVTSVPAGNVVGVAGLEEQVLKTATLSSTTQCPSLAPLLVYAQPILRVSVEARSPAQMGALVKGLRLLNQADPSARTHVRAGEAGPTRPRAHVEAGGPDLGIRTQEGARQPPAQPSAPLPVQDHSLGQG